MASHRRHPFNVRQRSGCSSERPACRRSPTHAASDARPGPDIHHKSRHPHHGRRQQMTAIQERVSRSAYGRLHQSHNATLVEVGPGTPCGEMMRRYWHPIGASTEVTETPQIVRVLGEDLVLFRDRAGRPGLLYPRCMHRGTSLYYGKVEERGIRCCYHGWLFDVNGACLEQPLEPNCGINKDVAAQPSYPVEERYGLVFAYMGPPDRQPVLPRYDNLEELAPGEFLQVDTSGFVGYSDVHPDPSIPYNWLQHFENLLDQGHIYVLHQGMTKFKYTLGADTLPKGRFEYIDGGVTYTRYLKVPSGQTVYQTSVLRLPNVSLVPNVSLDSMRGNPKIGL